MNRRTFLEVTSDGTAGLTFLPLSGLGAATKTLQRAYRSEDLFELFRDPPAEARPFVRWWWNGGRVVKEELLRELDLMKSAGLGGVEINPIAFPDTSDPVHYKALEWLSDEWLDMLEATVAGAKQRGMICDLIVGSGWPFGGEFLPASEHTQMLWPGTRNLQGPKRYEFDRKELLDEVEPPVMSKRENKTKDLVYLRLVPAQMQEFAAGTSLDEQAKNDRIVIDVPTGDYVLYYLVKLTGFESVIHGAPGANGPVLNHYDKRAVARFLNRMSDAIEGRMGRLGDHFRSMFVDSMELEGANWCDDMPDQFAKRRGYRLEPYVPFILFKTGRMGRPLEEAYGIKASGDALDQIQRARHDFEVTKMEVFGERFLDTLLDWCRKHRVKSRIQAYGRELHPLEASLDVDIPDSETWLRPPVGKPLREQDSREGRGYTQVNKFVASAARLKGKRLVACEELTNTSGVFNATLERLKITADQSTLTGITQSIFHGFNYSPPDAPFPGWVRYGTFFNERNPWWPYFRKLVDYKARLSAVFQNADLFADIAVMHPLADHWSMFGAPWHPSPEKVHPVYVFNIWEALHQSGHSCDYLSERILRESRFRNGTLSYGPRTYKTLILIEVESMEPDTAEALKRFAKAGGTIVFIGKEPSRAPGLKNHEARDKAVVETIALIRKKHGANVILHPAPEPKEAMLDWLKPLAEKINLKPYIQFDRPTPSVSQVRYTAQNCDILFVANSNQTDSYDIQATINLPDRTTAWLWDPETGERSLCPAGGSPMRLRIELPPANSRLIVLDGQKAAGNPWKLPALAETAMTVPGPWSLALEHVNGNRKTITLDKLADFKDNAELKTFAGIAQYQTTFNIADSSQARYLDLGKVYGVTEVTLNGKPLGVRWYGNHIFDLAGALRGGTNELSVKLTTTLGNYIKSLKDHKDSVKWLKSQPVNSVGVLGPVRVG